MPKGKANEERKKATATRLAEHQRTQARRRGRSDVTGEDQVDGAIDAVLSVLDKKLGVGFVARMADEDAYPEVKHVIPTGSSALDQVFGTKDASGQYGAPLGKVIEIFGPESVGKTTLMKALAARAQGLGVVPVIADGEHAGVLEFDKGLGLDPRRALISQPDTLEETFEIYSTVMKEFHETHTMACCICDSLASIACAAEAEAGFDQEARIGLRAKFLSQNLKKLVSEMKHGDGEVGLYFVNQVREKIGAMPYQKQTFSPGGRALRHYAHVRLEMSSRGLIKSGDRVIGVKSNIKAVKNKLAPPYREAELDFYFDPPRVVDAKADPTAVSGISPIRPIEVQFGIQTGAQTLDDGVVVAEVRRPGKRPV